MKTIVIAKALIIDVDNNALFLRRSKTHPDRALMPDLPGGQLEDGEEPGNALVREILEETGLQVSTNDLSILYAGAEVHGGENRVRILYRARLHEAMPKVEISWEHDKAEWLPIDELEHMESKYHTFYHDALVYVRTHKLLDA